MNNSLINFILGVNPDIIHKYVIIAPCWLPDSVGVKATLISKKTCELWECKVADIDVTYIVPGVGACGCADIVMSLKETKCKYALFIGSAGALSKGISIGDIAFPSEIICAEGASRFLYNNIENDLFGRKYHVDSIVLNSICKIEKMYEDYKVNIHYGLGISVESIISQYKHINKMIGYGCSFIDMESSAFLAASECAGIKSAIAYCISDNVMQEEPLYLVSEEKLAYRKQIRKEIFPNIIYSFVKGESNIENQ